MLSATQQEIIIHHFIEYKPILIGIFGSYARAENTDLSDLDLLIDLKLPLTLLTLIKLESELSEKLGVKIDLVTTGALKNKLIKENINKDLKVIYSA